MSRERQHENQSSKKLSKTATFRKLSAMFFILSFGILFFSSPVLTAQSDIDLSFNDGLALKDGRKAIQPTKARNIKLVPGISGKAVHIPKDGYLEYPAESLFNPEEGTITLWIKLDNTPWGILAFRDRDKLPNGDWGNKVHGSPFNRTIFATGSTYSSINSYVSFVAMGSFFALGRCSPITSTSWRN